MCRSGRVLTAAIRVISPTHCGYVWPGYAIPRRARCIYAGRRLYRLRHCGLLYNGSRRMVLLSSVGLQPQIEFLLSVRLFEAHGAVEPQLR